MFKFLQFFFGSDAPDANKDEGKLAADLVRAADGLDIETAIASHENWKLRLKLYLAGTSQEVFSPDVVCLDNRCALGKWIYSKGSLHLGKYPGFSALQTHHKLFHHTSSNIVSLVQAGKKPEAEKILSTQFEGFSRMIVEDLQRMLDVVNSTQHQRS